MASRPGSLEKLDKAVKELSKRVPEWKDSYDLLFGLSGAKPKSAARDRTAALSAATFIEYALQQAITTHLRKGVTKTEVNLLFGSNGAPLASFHAKILLAHSLGIISSEDQRELTTIRNIRNAFAHSITLIKFSDKPVKDLCLTLSIAKSFSDLKKPSAARYVYISAVATIFFDLIDYYDGREAEIFAAATAKT